MGREGRDRVAAHDMLPAEFKSAAELIAAKAAFGDFGRADASDRALGRIVGARIIEGGGEIGRAECLDSIEAEMAGIGMAAGRQAIGREMRAAAARGKTHQQVGRNR